MFSAMSSPFCRKRKVTPQDKAHLFWGEVVEKMSEGYHAEFLGFSRSLANICFLVDPDNNHYGYL